jgi:segregation and condensation protein B
MDLKNKLEALLFASGRKMDLDELARLVKVRDRKVIKDKLIELKKEYETRESPIIVIEEGEHWKLTTHEKFIQIVRQINTHTELSKTIMETLAVIAWKQPMLQSDVINIRTNKAYDHIKELREMGFVVKERYGRTYLLKLTQKFFEYFDVRNDDSLKALFKEIKEEVLDQKQVGDFNPEEGNPIKELIEGTEQKTDEGLKVEDTTDQETNNDQPEDETENKEETDETEEDKKIVKEISNIENTEAVLEAEDLKMEENNQEELLETENVDKSEISDLENNEETELEKELNEVEDENIQS